MIYEAKRRSIFTCDEYELALLHCFGAIWGGGTNHDGHGFYGFGGIDVFPHHFGDLHARIMVYLYKAILHPGLVECLYRSFFAGRRIRCTWFNNRLCRLPMIASSDIDQRLPASGTWHAPVIKVVTALNPAFSSASGLLKRGGKAMPGVCRSLRYVILVLRLRFDGKCKSFGGQLWQDEFCSPICFSNMTSFNISPV